MPNILIVDDDNCLAFILSEYLEAAGHGCTHAENVKEARRHLGQQIFDLVISDVNMPGESGFDLLRDVASYHTGTAFLFMSATDDIRNIRRAIQMGANGYLVKPFRLTDLHAKISTLVKSGPRRPAFLFDRVTEKLGAARAMNCCG